VGLGLVGLGVTGSLTIGAKTKAREDIMNPAPVSIWGNMIRIIQWYTIVYNSIKNSIKNTIVYNGIQ
jgi:hypothetical protein